MYHKGKLLVIEKNFKYAAEHFMGSDATNKIFKAIEPYNKFSYIKDAVDDIIEKVLENGGDVEFVENGLLKEYNQIALIQYY
jgi:inosine-uridine nucleoside N-ribohydrolase